MGRLLCGRVPCTATGFAVVVILAIAPSLSAAAPADERSDLTALRDELPELRAVALDEAAKSADYAGSWFDAATGELVIAFASTDSDRDAKVAALLPAEVKAGTRFTRVQHSLVDLRERHRRVADQLGKGVEGVGLDIKNNGLVVMSMSESEAEQAVRRANVLDVSVTYIEGTNSEETCSSRASCGGSSSRRGGVAITYNGYSCTSGLTADYFGTRYSVTAGHCWWGYTSGLVHSGGQSYGTLNPDNMYFAGSGCDCRLVPTTPGVTAANRVYYSTASPYLTVTGKTLYSAVGDSVRLLGRLTQSNGTISYVDFAYIGENCGCELIGSVLASYSSMDGDSGGAVTSTGGTVGKGIHSGWSGAYGRFFEVARIQDYLGVTVLP